MTIDLPPDFQPAEVDLIRRVGPYTMTTPERIVHLAASIRYLCMNHIGGAIVECGVWRGGSMMAAAYSLLAQGDIGRELFLFDTYEGMPPPQESDVDLHGGVASEYLEANPRTEDDHVWAYAPLDMVKRNLASTGYPVGRMHFVPGKVEDTLPHAEIGDIALLRLDTDWYASTKHELETLYDRLVPGGVLIIDDYGWWRGSREATDEFLDRLPVRPLLHRIDVAARSCIKPNPLPVVRRSWWKR